MSNLIIIRNDGKALSIPDYGMQVKNIHEQLSKQQTIAVKIGQKVFSRNTIVAVLTEECADTTLNHNLYISVLNNPLRCTVDDLDKALEKLTEDVNTNNYVLVNDQITFNKQGFQFAEENIKE
ncbi:hypothetical protein [Lysinibacillus xylanilyticus]|uniref:hypothetical protein n=1 Tax=Lysinibacillus xylanilyticus TaxID=582475 RepID=UPI003CFD5DB9